MTEVFEAYHARMGLRPATHDCAHCGRQCGDLIGGWGMVGDAHVCHPNVLGRPDCYRRITVYGEPVGFLLGSDDSRELPI